MDRPQLVYDDDCRFCTWVAERAIHYGPFELVGLSDVTDEQRERLPENFEECSHFITDDAVYSCGESAERALARMFPVLGAAFAVLRRVPGYPTARERLYRLVSDNRPWIQKVVGSEPPAEGYTDDQ